MEIRGKTLVITGGASGIGRALAVAAVTRGARVAIADRDLEGAEETAKLATESCAAGSLCTAHPLDVSSLEQWRSLREAVLAEYGQVDGIINNAGISFSGHIEDTSYEQLERVMSINFMGMVYGSKEFLPLIKTRPQGLIANVSSVFGLFPRKRQGAYCASKYAIRGFTEELAQELKDTKVLVTSIHPGHIGTNIVQNARDEGNVVGVELSEQEQDMWTQAFKAMGMIPERAARIILDGISQDRRKIMVGRDAVRGDRLSRIAPVLFADAANKAAL